MKLKDATTMDECELRAELHARYVSFTMLRDERFTMLRDESDELGSGSPDEWLIERVWELEAELLRRGLPT